MGYFTRGFRSGGGKINIVDKNNRYQRPGNDKGKFGRKCHNYGKTGHKKENCWSRNKTEDTGSSIGYLMSDVEIDGEIFDIEKKKNQKIYFILFY